MAGTDSNFPASEVRSALRATMTMGMPGSTALQATFRWTEQKTYSVSDPGGRPYDWTATPTATTTHADVIVPVAVALTKGTPDQGTSAGVFTSSTATITILDDDYDSIEGADQVVLGGATYDIVEIPIPEALFDLTVYTIIAVARSNA